MESARRMAVRNPQSTNTRYTIMLDNWKNSDDQDVHKLVTISRMTNLKRQDN